MVSLISTLQSNNTAYAPPTPWLLYAIVAVVVVGIVVLVRRRRKSKKQENNVGAIPALRVLVLCPFCGAKTEQGITQCWKCGAQL